MKILCFAFATAAIAVFVFLFQRHAPMIISWIHHLGYLAPIFFLLVFCLATLLFLPTMVLTLAGGALFGPFLGILMNLIGATLGAACAFCISRYLVFDWVASKKNERIHRLIHGVERGGWQFVAMVRILPIIPFNLVNYVFGITRIKFSHYLLATLIFLIPTEIITTWCGYAGMDILIHTEEACYSQHLFLIVGIIILFMGIMLFKRRQSRCLRSMQ